MSVAGWLEALLLVVIALILHPKPMMQSLLRLEYCQPWWQGKKMHRPIELLPGNDRDYFFSHFIGQASYVTNPVSRGWRNTLLPKKGTR